MVFRETQTAPIDDVTFAGFKRGEKLPFKAICDTFVRRLTWYCNRKLESVKIKRYPLQAEDIVAQTFYKLYHAREKLNSADHVTKFLFVVTRNAVIDLLRRNQAENEFFFEYRWLVIGHHLDPSINNEHPLAGQLVEVIKKNGLVRGKRNQEVFTMFFEWGMTAVEIGKAIGLHRHSVTNIRTAIIKNLREKIVLEMQGDVQVIRCRRSGPRTHEEIVHEYQRNKAVLRKSKLAAAQGA